MIKAYKINVLTAKKMENKIQKMKSSLDKYEHLNRWEDEDSLDGPNVYATLFNKLTHYEHAYRQQTKNEELILKYEANTETGETKNSPRPQRMKSLTTEISNCYRKNQSLTKAKIMPHRRIIQNR